MARTKTSNRKEVPTSSGGGGEKPPRRPGKGKRPPASARFDHLAGLIHLLKVLMLKGVFGSVVHLHGKDFDDIYRHIFSHCSNEGSFSGMHRRCVALDPVLNEECAKTVKVLEEAIGHVAAVQVLVQLVKEVIEEKMATGGAGVSGGGGGPSGA